MPTYHFNIYDGVNILDEEGSELPDMAYARREAIRYCAALLEDGAEKNNFGEDWRMEVTDAAGLILFQLDFHITATPAAIRATMREC